MRSQALQGVLRSLRIYHGDPARELAMDGLHARFLRAGDLAFDIGAHVGDRVSSFRRLGARVVAVEPQPLCHRALRLIHGRDASVRLIEAAVAEMPGRLALQVNRANPTVSTASEAFIGAAAGASGWETQRWDDRIDVASTTLDALIAEHGVPQFTKIDVEGFELAVLRGLTCALPTLSFEFTTIQREVAVACVRRMCDLGQYRFNLALGESQKLTFAAPVSAAGMEACLLALPPAANSGDVYATLA